jgi:hypothetical protein
VIVLFTIRATERKARDLNPHSPKGNRVSSAARPTLSGYLPSESIRNHVDHRGVEPRFPGCKPGVFPLDQQPVSVVNDGKVRPRIELHPSSYKERMPPAHSRTTLLMTQRPRWDLNPRSPP